MRLIKFIWYCTVLQLIIIIKRFIYKVMIRIYATPKRLQKAINKANKLHEKTGLRYRVFFLDMRYRVICREDMKDMKRSGFFVYKTNSTNLDKYKYYDTLDGKVTLTQPI
jgi:hypothetical protein